MKSNTMANSRNMYMEVYSVINALSSEEKKKIPKYLKNSLNKKALGVTLPIYLNKPLESQISREALIVLTCLGTKYLFNYEEKQILKKSLLKNNSVEGI